MNLDFIARDAFHIQGAAELSRILSTTCKAETDGQQQTGHRTIFCWEPWAHARSRWSACIPTKIEAKHPKQKKKNEARPLKYWHRRRNHFKFKQTSATCLLEKRKCLLLALSFLQAFWPCQRFRGSLEFDTRSIEPQSGLAQSNWQQAEAKKLHPVPLAKLAEAAKSERGIWRSLSPSPKGRGAEHIFTRAECGKERICRMCDRICNSGLLIEENKHDTARPSKGSASFLADLPLSARTQTRSIGSMQIGIS